MRCDIILLVEDNPDDVKQTLRAFERNDIGNQVVVARDGAEALDYLHGTGAYAGRDTSVQPGLVLLDLKLPRVTGLEVLKRLRADPRTVHVPVVVLTSSWEERDLLRSYALGANIYVRKPVQMTDFLNAARHLGLYWSLLESGLALLHRDTLRPGADPQVTERPPERAPPESPFAAWPMEVLVAGGFDNFRMVRDLLGPQGHVVAHAKDAKDAFGVLHAGLPDVVLVDGALADIGGIELVRALRRSPQGERLTVILLAPNPERMREDLQDEAVRVIAPPIQGEWLVTLMEQLRAERNSSIWPASNADTF